MSKPRRSRRGVLLLVVLSLLIMFVLVGATFIVVATNYRNSAALSSTHERTGDPPQNVLDRALYQVLRGTLNSKSTVGPHSLLEDSYVLHATIL